MKIFIKHMVSIRCKMIVKSELDKLALEYGAVDLGEVELKEPLSKAQREQLKAALINSGLILMDDKKAILVEKIKKYHHRDDSLCRRVATGKEFDLSE